MREKFNSIELAKKPIGQLVDYIKDTLRDTSKPEPKERDLFNMALLLQASLRALLPVEERAGVAKAKTFRQDSLTLRLAQQNYNNVFLSGMKASAHQRDLALTDLKSVGWQLHNQGYMKVADDVFWFVYDQNQTSMKQQPEPVTPSGTLMGRLSAVPKPNGTGQ